MGMFVIPPGWVVFVCVSRCLKVNGSWGVGFRGCGLAWDIWIFKYLGYWIFDLVGWQL